MRRLTIRWSATQHNTTQHNTTQISRGTSQSTLSSIVPENSWWVSDSHHAITLGGSRARSSTIDATIAAEHTEVVTTAEHTEVVTTAEHTEVVTTAEHTEVVTTFIVQCTLTNHIESCNFRDSFAQPRNGKSLLVVLARPGTKVAYA